MSWRQHDARCNIVLTGEGLRVVGPGFKRRRVRLDGEGWRYALREYIIRLKTQKLTESLIDRGRVAEGGGGGYQSQSDWQLSRDYLCSPDDDEMGQRRLLKMVYQCSSTTQWPAGGAPLLDPTKKMGVIIR
jgi:hypothetical protein